MTSSLRARILAALLVLGPGCGVAVEPPREFQNLTRCEEPRPEACTYDYEPVCGLIRTVRVCPEAPCHDRLEWRTFSNACTACADERVESWKPGACPAGEEDARGR